MSKISLFPHIREAKQSQDITVDLFLDNIQNGKWQDLIIPLRAVTDKKKRQELKQALPYVTLSGRFSERKISGLLEHSGFIGIDIDDVENVEKIKKTLSGDRHVYAAFVSVSGRGICAIFKINPNKHAEAFEGLQEYLYNNYQIIIDPSGKDVSRPRYVSYDPYIFQNVHCAKFTYTPKKEKALTKVPDVVFVQSDFDLIIKDICDRGIDITGSYHTWLQIGFSLADKFGDAGRQYYHSVSSFSISYNPALCDRQYTNCLKAGRHGITIATFYYLCKNAGITIVSDQTKLISQKAYNTKVGRMPRESAIKYLEEQEGLSPEITTDIVNQVFDNNIVIKDASEIEAVDMWLRETYNLRRNLITRYIEHNGEPLQKKDFNSIWIEAKKVFDKVDFQTIERLIDSNNTPGYNPLIDFLKANEHRKTEGLIQDLADTIKTDTGMCVGEFDPQYAFYFIRKWLVGIISAIHGKHSPLLLVLCGELQGTGKTEWFRRLLPVELRKYYAESKLDRDKDDEILMTQKVIIMNDEMGGATQKDEKRLKELTSKQTFSLREPYGKGNVDLVRLAVLCGTTNIRAILNDPTGNRRIIPINVLSIDHMAYNAIDKTDLLIEAYSLYVNGFDWELTKQDIKRLSDNTTVFEKTSAEAELIGTVFELPDIANKPYEEFLTATEIKSRLEIFSKQSLNATKLGIELKKAGFERKSTRRNGLPIYGFFAVDKLRPRLTPPGL